MIGSVSLVPENGCKITIFSDASILLYGYLHGIRKLKLIFVHLQPCSGKIAGKPRDVAQLASAPRSGRGGRKFESSHPDFASLAQLVEQLIRN
jgi:hypothetical protein